MLLYNHLSFIQNNPKPNKKQLNNMQNLGIQFVNCIYTVIL